MIKLPPIILAALAGTVHAGVPHEFVPNTPARAAQVNENFQHLDTRVQSLESMPFNASKCTIPRGIEHEYTYNPKQIAYGASVNIGGQNYTPARIPFIDRDTGDVYAITHLVGLSEPYEIGNGISRIGEYLVTLPAEGMATCLNEDHLISGFSVYEYRTDIWFESIPAIYFENGAISKKLFGVTEQAEIELFIKVNGTAVKISYLTEGRTIHRKNLTDNLQDNLDWAAHLNKGDIDISDTSAFSLIDEVIDYIHIEKISP